MKRMLSLGTKENADNSILGTVKNILRRYGYTEPTFIQKAAIPYILDGYNTLIIAPTGAGKTEAALLPIFALIEDHKQSGEKKHTVRAIYVTPLRALNRDIFIRMRNIAEQHGISLSVRHGDSTDSERKKFLENPPEIFITTPESLVFLLSIPRLSNIFSRVKWLIIDEIHELMVSERGIELILGIERIRRKGKRKIQLIGLSATIPRSLEKEIYRVFSRYGYTVVIKDNQVKDIKITVETREGEKACLDDHVDMLDIPEGIRCALPIISSYLEKSRSTLIFVNTRDTAEWLGASINRFLGKEQILVHHGSLDRDKRITAEQALKKGKIKGLIATSSMELGIDVGRIDTVIQFGSPRQAVKLLQRVGRSGHRLNAISRGIIVVPGDNVFEILEAIVLARRAKNLDLEDALIPRERYTPLIHQIAGMLVENNTLNIDELYDLITSTYPFNNLQRKTFLEVLDFMASIGLARFTGNHRIVRIGKRTISYYFSTTMIPDEQRYDVIDFVTRKRIGYLDRDFVLSSMLGENNIILGGKVWRVISITNGKIYVEEAGEQKGLPPVWIGELIPISYKTSREVCSIIRRILRYSNYEFLKKEYGVNNSLARKLVRKIISYKERGSLLPLDNALGIEYSGNYLIIYTCLGSRGNEAFGLLLSTILSDITGTRASYFSSPYYVIIHVPKEVSSSNVKTLLYLVRKIVLNNALIKVLSDAIRKSTLYKVKVIEYAQKMGIIDKGKVNDFDYSLLLKLKNSLVEKEVLRVLLEEKLDAYNLVNYLRRIVLKDDKIYIRKLNNLNESPLINDILAHNRQFLRRDIATVPTATLIEIFRRRLENKEIRLVCMLCGWNTVTMIKYLKEPIKCPQCGSKYIASINANDADSLNILTRYLQGDKLRKDEKERLDELMGRANLVLNYGKNAIIALATTGVGVVKARKILATSMIRAEDLYSQLFNAEREYLRTRAYWRD